jgi:1-deoxy-D-xylulose-5-phosphate synthase
MTRLLDTINGPSDLRAVPLHALPALATEIRQLIIETVAANSGHLASNLGTVELTLALARAFDFDRDAVIWDVGHQAYTYKILTGRRESFRTLRQQGGLSGFPNRSESPYDHFTTGHAGTSLSTALGLALARRAAGDPGRVIAVIGDGAIASGTPFEALNHIGHLKTNLIVVLNDNRMSIGRTIGALARYLNRLRTARAYTGAKRDVHRALHRVPLVGKRVEDFLGYVKEGLKLGFVREHLFTDLGLNYFGLLDGHDIPALIETMREVQTLDEPVMLHVVTEKGRGFTPATRDPTAFHSATPRTFRNGGGRIREKVEGEEQLARSYTDVFAETLPRLAAEDPRVVAITAAMCDGCGLTAFERAYPNRFIDCGICEQHAAALASGLATGGRRPILAIYSTFLQRAYDQVFQEIALQQANVVLAIDRAGLVGSDGPTHHGVFDIAYLRHLPGMTLCAPRDGPELAALLRWALGQEGPVAIRYPREDLPTFEAADRPPIVLGRSETLRTGADAAIFAYGAMVSAADDAARLLAHEDGLQVAVVNARFAKPLDLDAIHRALDETPVVVTAEDHALAGGFGSAVLEAAAARAWPVERIVCLGLPDRFVAHAPRAQLLARLGLDAAGIAESVRTALGEVRNGRARSSFAAAPLRVHAARDDC